MGRAAIAAAWVASLLAVYLVAPPAAAPAPPSSSTATATAVRERCAVTAATGALSAETVRAVVREELAAARATAAVAPPVEPPVEPSEGFLAASELVERALARGEWTAGDRDELRKLLRAGMARPEAETLFQQLLPAVNEGRLRTVGLDASGAL